jgi:hypothetical protein
LALTFQQFDALTPKEFQHRLRASAEKEQREFERLAQLACWVINPWLSGSKPVAVRDLLRRPGEMRRRQPTED